MDFNLPSNLWVSQLQKYEFAVLVLGFEKLGLELDNRGRTTKNAYCRIYIYGHSWLTLFASNFLAMQLNVPKAFTLILFWTLLDEFDSWAVQ